VKLHPNIKHKSSGDTSRQRVFIFSTLPFFNSKSQDDQFDHRHSDSTQEIRNLENGASAHISDPAVVFSANTAMSRMQAPDVL
jgi:hypothetical protein